MESSKQESPRAAQDSSKESSQGASQLIAQQPAQRAPKRLPPWTLVICALAFVGLVLVMPPPGLAVIRWPVPSWFWAFAVLPGLAGITNHLIAQRHRAEDSKAQRE